MKSKVAKATKVLRWHCHCLLDARHPEASRGGKAVVEGAWVPDYGVQESYL